MCMYVMCVYVYVRVYKVHVCVTHPSLPGRVSGHCPHHETPAAVNAVIQKWIMEQEGLAARDAVENEWHLVLNETFTETGRFVCIAYRCPAPPPPP